MINILTQDKDEVMECKCIYQDGCDVVEDYSVESNNVEVLGTYATEKRAKEIISEIFGTIIRHTKYYEMPKNEEEV